VPLRRTLVRHGCTPPPLDACGETWQSQVIERPWFAATRTPVTKWSSRVRKSAAFQEKRTSLPRSSWTMPPSPPVLSRKMSVRVKTLLGGTANG
jgi:hypothetical protein